MEHPKPLSFFGWKLTERDMLIALMLGALIVRALVAYLTVDVASDGPAHAMHAYAFSRNPHIEGAGRWLPGNQYLAGLCCMLYPNPRVTPRVLNLILGTATLPLLYLLIRDFYGRTVAMLSAYALAALPLHIELSASSMTEPGFLFFVVTALLCLRRALATANIRYGMLALSVLASIAAEMTRYEGWSLIPLTVAYLFWRTRKLALTLEVLALLMVFPLQWSIESWRSYGDLLFGARTSLVVRNDAVRIHIVESMYAIYRQLNAILRWFLLFPAIAGLLLELSRLIRGRRDLEHAAYALFVTAVWVLILVTVPWRADELYSRLLLLGSALLLPFAVLFYLEIFGRSRYAVASVIGIMLVSSVLAYRGATDFWVMRALPDNMIAAARWLNHSSHRDDFILMTAMHWDAQYLPLYAPQMQAHYNVIAAYSTNDQILWYAHRKHALLLTYGDNDERDRANFERIEKVLGITLTPQQQIVQIGRIEVFDISDCPPGAAYCR